MPPWWSHCTRPQVATHVSVSGRVSPLNPVLHDKIEHLAETFWDFQWSQKMPFGTPVFATFLSFVQLRLCFLCSLRIPTECFFLWNNTEIIQDPLLCNYCEPHQFWSTQASLCEYVPWSPATSTLPVVHSALAHLTHGLFPDSCNVTKYTRFLNPNTKCV